MRRTVTYQGIQIPCVDPWEMAMIDCLMLDTYHISLIQMMENAGAALAALAVELMYDKTKPETVVVLAGKGGNGGGGLVAARRLAAWGLKVNVILADDNLAEIPRIQKAILDRMGVPVWTFESGVKDILAQPALVIDALVGYSLKGKPKGAVATLIEWANHVPDTVVSLDVPSGLNPLTGFPEHPTIRAMATLTLALPKTGLLAPTAQSYVGQLYLGDISIPLSLYSKLDIDVPRIFRGSPYVKL